MHKPKAALVWVWIRTGAFGRWLAKVFMAVFLSWRSK